MSLRTQLTNCQNRMHEIHDEIEGIGNLAETENRDISEEEAGLIDGLRNEFEGLESKKETLKKACEAAERVAAARAADDQLSAQNSLTVPGVAGGGGALPRVLQNQRSKVFANTADCYAMGQWLFGMIGNENSRRWALDHGYDYRNAQEVGTPAAGGYTVPTPLAAEIIRLIEEYGVFRRFSRNMPMSAMTLDVPKRDSGLTVQYPAEGASITPSDIATSQVNLVAKKYALLNLMSTELAEDAIISWTDLVASEMAWAIALAEDTNSFLGDGSGTYGGITGIDNALLAGSRITAGAGVWGGVTLGHLEQLAGLPPAFPGFEGRWYMSKYAYFNVVVSLLNAAGGTDMRQIEAGGELMLMGYPVTWAQVLPGSAAAGGDMGIVFGDLSIGSMLGTRRELNIRILTELYAASDQLGIVSTTRSDTQIHDPGTASVAGSIVALDLAI